MALNVNLINLWTIITIMSYIEERKHLQKNQYYFIKRLSLLSNKYAIKKYVGTNLISKEKFILDNLQQISHEEFKWRKQFLSVLIYSGEVLEKNELLSITLRNLIEGKNCEKEVYVEFSKEFIFNSNNIEGSRIPLIKVKEIVEKGNSKYSNQNEIKEVKNSIDAFTYIQTTFRFNLSSIKQLYHILTKGLFREGNQVYPRGFKKEDVVVANSQTTSYMLVEEELQSLLNWYKKYRKTKHPLELAFEFHLRFEKIHPFLDGNGRTGRFLMNKILLSGGYPPIIVFTANKQAYFNSLSQNKKMFQFLVEQSIKSYELLTKIAKKY